MLDLKTKNSGFYLNGTYYFINTIRLFIPFLLNTPGVGFNFLNLLMYRLERHSLSNLVSLFNSFNTLALYVLINLLQIIFPPKLTFINQFRLNIYRYYLIKSKRGVFLSINKPLRQRTRSNTYGKRIALSPSLKLNLAKRNKRPIKRKYVRFQITFARKTPFKFVYIFNWTGLYINE